MDLKMCQWLSIILCFSICVDATALDAAWCRPIVSDAKTNELSLNTESKTSVYLLQNISDHSVWIDHQSHKTANAGWASYIRAGKWSALMLNRKDFTLTCAQITPGAVNHLNCATTISVCQVDPKYTKSRSTKSFWISEDVDYATLLQNAKRRKVW
jgi:hypothetical protein